MLQNSLRILAEASSLIRVHSIEEGIAMKRLILMTVAMCLAASTLGGCYYCNDVGNLESEMDGKGVCYEYNPSI
jgi:hypothetical protein